MERYTVSYDPCYHYNRWMIMNSDFNNRPVAVIGLGLMGALLQNGSLSWDALSSGSTGQWRLQNGHLLWELCSRLIRKILKRQRL